MLGGSGAYDSFPEKILKMWCSLVCCGVYFLSDCVLKNSLKINTFLHNTMLDIFLYKKNYYVGTRLLWGTN